MQSLEKTHRASIAEVKKTLLGLQAKVKPLQQEIGRFERLQREYEDKLALAVQTPKCSDHAVIRYLERVYGFDFEKQRAELLTGSVKAAMQLGAKKVKREDCTLVLNGNTIVTITD